MIATLWGRVSTIKMRCVVEAASTRCRFPVPVDPLRKRGFLAGHQTTRVFFVMLRITADARRSQHSPPLAWCSVSILASVKDQTLIFQKVSRHSRGHGWKKSCSHEILKTEIWLSSSAKRFTVRVTLWNGPGTLAQAQSKPYKKGAPCQ